jgi:hypothetical protein
MRNGSPKYTSPAIDEYYLKSSHVLGSQNKLRSYLFNDLEEENSLEFTETP